MDRAPGEDEDLRVPLSASFSARAGVVLGFEGKDPHGLQPLLCSYHFLSVAEGTWTGPRAGFLRWHGAKLGMYSKSTINESCSCEKGEIRGGWREGPACLVSTTFPHIGRAQRRLPGGPSVPKAVHKRFIFFS